ncbi:hypothetical protein BJ165DRAFT_1464631 [Panaeolus papilionaceus]|nr:hypothetical protein BJ165DRAFT_1464631 [Panaeolus papilionaceus]
MSFVSFALLTRYIPLYGYSGFHSILYLTPITRGRMTRSQRQALETFQTITGVETAVNITIVTTMWDYNSTVNNTYALLPDPVGPHETGESAVF